MEVRKQPLVPRMQYEREADLAAERGAAKLQKGLGHRVKQQSQQRTPIAFAPEDELVQLVRYGEHVVEVRYRQELFLAGCHPSGRSRALALRTMTVAAAVVGVPLESARRAPLAMAAQSGGSAVGNCPYSLALRRSDAMRLLVCPTILLKNVGELAGSSLSRYRTAGRGTGHGDYSATPEPLGTTASEPLGAATLGSSGTGAAESWEAGTPESWGTTASESWGRRSRSRGLWIPSRCWLVTCRYFAVLLRLAWPIKRWIVGNGTPASIRCVANECRRQWIPCPCTTPARSLAA